jgi:hypothetical protein
LNQECTKVPGQKRLRKRKQEDPPGRQEGRMLSPRQAEEPQALQKHGVLTEPSAKELLNFPMKKRELPASDRKKVSFFSDNKQRRRAPVKAFRDNPQPMLVAAEKL